MAYKCVRESLITYYCPVCLDKIAEGDADRIYIHVGTDVFFVEPLFYIICPKCGHYERLNNDEFGFYYRDCEVIKDWKIK
jgi:hypothetical protein